MNTILAAITLVIFGAVARFFVVWIINIAGLPGAMIGLKKPGKVRAIIAAIVSGIGQSYFYLAYTAFVVNWTGKVNARGDTPLAFLLWPLAFLAVTLPIWLILMKAREDARERGFMNVQDEALHITAYLSALGFLTFASIPRLITFGWGWLPYL